MNLCFYVSRDLVIAYCIYKCNKKFRKHIAQSSNNSTLHIFSLKHNLDVRVLYNYKLRQKIQSAFIASAFARGAEKLIAEFAHQAFIIQLFYKRVCQVQFVEVFSSYLEEHKLERIYGFPTFVFAKAGDDVVLRVSY
eukprot:TRINITY_DN4833_c0_g2_i2.p10 TRINITY_DN4833_c0_g2~~TRINITY_DN4833_c0_g2_i2.p10  ORF type:complete len:137 (-),score=6.36 TRINITY_DN4833_c0_g2_i2:276-686(-)